MKKQTFILLLIGSLLFLMNGCKETKQAKSTPEEIVFTLVGSPGGDRQYKMEDLQKIPAATTCMRYVSNIVIDGTLADSIIDRNLRLAIVDMFDIYSDGKAYSVRAFNGKDKIAFITCDFAPFGDWSSCCLHDYTLDQFKLKIWR